MAHGLKFMIRHSALARSLMLASIIAAASCAVPTRVPVYGIDDVQGYWWSDCGEPAVEFAIQGNRYFGDFEGEFPVEVKDGVLSVDHGPGTGLLSYRIIHVSDTALVLQPINPPAPTFSLRSCP
jgi:hypothetical protein